MTLRTTDREATVRKWLSEWLERCATDEGTGELRHLKNPCLVLDGVVCRGRFKRFCPRANDCYWREAWLRRVETDRR